MFLNKVSVRGGGVATCWGNSAVVVVGAEGGEAVGDWGGEDDCAQEDAAVRANAARDMERWRDGKSIG
jgi:hypothetical protein